MAVLRIVLAKRTAYTRITNAATLRQYVINCVSYGTASTLFAVPSILATVYAAGTSASVAIQTAITNHDNAPTKANLKIIEDKMALAVLWLDSYVALVVTIANLSTNCTTRAEAATNIATSYLTPQNIVAAKKGKPNKPIFVVKNTGTGMVETEIINGDEYQPTSMTFVLISEPPAHEPPYDFATVSLSDGKLSIKSAYAVEIVTSTASGKGRFTEFIGLTSGLGYRVLAYAQNGKKQISLLSAVGYVKG
ncbi:MAG: hypothetical protein WCL14_00285 [Bacteroidota bacterium]